MRRKKLRGLFYEVFDGYFAQNFRYMRGHMRADEQ